MDDEKKVFINVCQTDGIPAPENITHDELEQMLHTETESNYRVPMSISELRQVPHRGVSNTVCDVAVNPAFFKIVRTDPLFSDFLIQIIIEAIDQKYNVQLNGAKCTILINKKHMGQLVRHRVQNRDVKKVYESYKSPDAETRQKLADLDGTTGKSRLIEELEPTKIIAAKKNIPSWRLKLREGLVIGEFYLPSCTHRDIVLEMNDDRLVLDAPKCKFHLDGFLERNVDVDRCTSQFLTDKSVSSSIKPYECEFVFILFCI